MNSRRLQALRLSLVVLGVMCMALGPLMIYWPSGWRWAPHQMHYEQMMVGIYLTLGVFLLIAARDPMRHLSLIWFAVWMSIVHGGIMAVQSLMNANERGHLIADIPALFIAAAVLAALTPARVREASDR